MCDRLQVFLEEAATAAGLSSYHVAVTVFLTGLLLSLTFAFIFTAMAVRTHTPVHDCFCSRFDFLRRVEYQGR